MNDIGDIAARRKAVQVREELKALGIDEHAPLTEKAVTDAGKSVEALREKAIERLSEGPANEPKDLTRFEGFKGEARAKAAEERSIALPVKVQTAPEENFATNGKKVSYTNGVYDGPKEHANVGLYAGTFDPPHAGHVDTVQRALKEGKLDEVYILVNRSPAYKPGATDFLTRQRMAELAFGGDRRVKFIDPADYKATSYPDILREIAAKNRRGFVTSISGDDVLGEKYFKPVTGSNIRYLVTSRTTDADMVEGAIKARFGTALEKDPGLVKRLDASESVNVSSTKMREAIAAGERPAGVPDAVANYAENKQLYQAPGQGRSLASVAPASDPARYSLVSKADDGLKHRLESAIKQGFDLGEKPRLSGAARIPMSAESEMRLRETAGLWSAVRPDQKLKSGIDEIVKSGKVSEKFAADSKELRARLKVMRFLCESLCTEDSQLAHLDQLTRAFGHLDDAAKPGFGSKEQITEAATRLREEMSASNLKAIDHELAQMQPLKAKDLADRLENDIKSIRKSIYSNDVSETDFHEVRKNIGRMQTVVLSNALSDDGKAKEKASYQVFRGLYDQIGDVHDDMVKSNLHGVDVGRVSFTDTQRSQIEKVLGYFEKSDRLEPGKLPKEAEKFADRDVRYSIARTDAEAGLSDQIKALIKNGSNTGEKPELSGVARIPLRQETEERMREIGKLWAEVRPGEALKTDLAEISRTGRVSEKFLADSKELRARMKVMRFFCEALCTEETQLNRLDKLTKTFGHLSDAATPGFGTREQIRAAATELRDSLSKGNLEKIDRELAKMEPLRAKDLATRLEESFSDMRKAIYSPAVSEKDFHEVRKTIGRMQTILLSNAFTESGTKEEKASFQAFRKLYDSIGDEHDEMVKNALNGAEVHKVAFTDSQRAQVEQLIGYFEKNERIEAGKLPQAARKYTDREVRFSLVAKESGAGLSRDRDQALSAVRSGYAAHFTPEQAATFTDGLSRRLADSGLDSAVVRASIEGASTGRRSVEEAAELTEQLAGKLKQEGYEPKVVAAAVGGAVGGPRTADEALSYARIVADDLKTAGFDQDSVAATLRGSIGGKLSPEEAVAYGRNLGADLNMDGFDQPTINAALRGGGGGDLTAGQVSTFTRDLTAQLKDAGLPRDISVAAVQGSLGKNLEVAEARGLAKDLVGKLTQQGFDHETIVAAVQGGAGDYRNADRTVGYARQLAGDPAAASRGAGTALTMVAEGDTKVAARGLASVAEAQHDLSRTQTAQELATSVAELAPRKQSFIKDAPIFGYRIKSDKFEDLPVVIRESLGSVDKTSYTPEYLRKNIGSVISLQMNGDKPDFYMIGKATYDSTYAASTMASVEEKNAKYLGRLKTAVPGLFKAEDPDLVPLLKTKPVDMVSMHDLGYPKEREVRIESPWGEQVKPAGQDAYLVYDDSAKKYYMVNVGADGSPLSYVSKNSVDVKNGLAELRGQASVSPKAYAQLLEKATPAEQAEIRAALGSKVAVTSDADQRFLKRLAGVDPNKSEFRDFLKKESDKPIQVSRNGYDKTKTITRMNATFDGFNSDVENARFKRFAEASNMGEPTRVKRSFLIETAVTKDLNDSVVKNKELVTSLMNKHKNMMWEAMSKDPFLMQHVEAKYNDFKSMKFGFSSNSPMIDHRMKDIFNDVNTRYSAYLASVVKDQGWDQKAHGLAADVGNWTHMGIGATPDEANWAARQSRTMLDANGLAHPRVFAEVEDRVMKDVETIRNLRQDLAKRFGDVKGMFVNEKGKSVFSAEAIEAIRKAKPLADGDEAITAAVKKSLDARFSRNFTEAEIKEIRAYAAKVDSFSPDLYLDKRVETPLDLRRNGIVSADFKGQNARNIEETMKALARAEGKPLSVQMREIRRGEQVATAALDRKKAQFLDAVTKLDPEAHDFVYFSGDDGIYLPSKTLSAEQKQQLARDVAEVDLRLTYNWHSYSDTGAEISSQSLSGYIGEAEEVEKNLRKEMIQHFPREQLNRTQLAIDMTPTSSGAKNVGVYVGGANSPAQMEAMQGWVRGYLEQHGHPVDFVEALAAAPAKAESSTASMVARGDLIYGRDALAELDRKQPALAAVLHYQQSGADALADARRRFLGGSASYTDLEEAEARFGRLGTAVNDSDEGARRVGYLAQEEDYLAHQVARATADGDTASATKLRVEQAAVTARMLGEQQRRESAIAANGELAKKARHGALESARKNFDRYAEEFPGRTFEQVTADPEETKMLKLLVARDAEAGETAMKEARERLESVVQDKLTSLNAPAETRAAKAKALAQDLVDLHEANGAPADLVKRNPDRWNTALVDSCVKEGLCSPRLEARSAQSVERELSPVARRVMAEDGIAHADSRAADQALTGSKLPTAKSYDEVITRLEADRKQLAADTARLAQNPDLKEVEKGTRQALSSVEERIKSLTADQPALKDAKSLTTAEEHLGDQAAEATLAYVDHAKPAELEKLGLHDLAPVKGEAKGAMLERVQDQLKAMPVEKRTQVVAAVFNDASKGTGEFAKELQKAKLDTASLTKAIDHSEDVAKAAGVKNIPIEHAVLSAANVPKPVQALSDALGATKAGAARKFDVAARVKELEANTKALAAKLERSPASLVPESFHDRAERLFGSLRTVTEAQRKEIEDGIDTVLKFEKGEKGEANARHILDTLKALASNPATRDQFETDRMAFVDAAKVMPTKKNWSEAWEDGVKQMLRDSDYKDEEINKVVDKASGTRFYQQTARCLGL